MLKRMKAPYALFICILEKERLDVWWSPHSADWVGEWTMEGEIQRKDTHEQFLSPQTSECSNNRLTAENRKNKMT